MRINNIIVAFALFVIVFTSCDDSSNVNAVSTNTTTKNSTTISGDTSKETIDLVKEGVTIVKDVIAEKRRIDSIRNANEPRLWVYQIGESYDDDNLAAKAYDKLKESESDIYVFRKKRKEYYIFKGVGVGSQKELEDSLSVIQKRTSYRISMRDLSKLCKKMPTVTDAIKYKIDGEKGKKYADCKTCE